MVLSNNPEPMFKFATKLHVWKNRVKKNGYSSLNLQIYISQPGRVEREYLPLNLEWPNDKIDLKNSTLLPRHRNDLDVNDYNMIIMTMRAKINEIAKMFRLAGRNLDVKSLKRELIFADSNKSVLAFIQMKRDELYNKKMISHQTWKHYGSLAKRIEQYDELACFYDLDKKWMDGFKSFLKAKGNAYNTIWGRIKELKALLHHANEEATIHVDPAVLTYSNIYIEQPITYLNKAEVSRLIELYEGNIEPRRSMTDIERNVLRAFLFSCFTSLRISDIYAAENSWMLSENFLSFTMAKNKDRRPKKICVPITPMAQNLIRETLKGKLFELPTQQEYNRTLKDIAQIASIKKRLTSHVGRHTFGYLFITSVGDIFALKEIMGHSKIETTQRYAHLDEDTKMEMVMKMQANFE